MFEQGNEGAHSHYGRYKGHAGAHEEERDVRYREERERFEQVVACGACDDGDSRHEGILGGSLAAHTEHHAAHDGGGRAGEARPQGKALETAYAESLLHRELVKAGGRHVVLTFGHDFLDDEHEQTASYKRRRYAERSEQGLDEAVKEQAERGAGQGGQDEQPDAAQAGEGRILPRAEQAEEADGYLTANKRNSNDTAFCRQLPFFTHIQAIYRIFP